MDGVGRALRLVRMGRAALVMSALVATSACASLTADPAANGANSAGQPYYLPMVTLEVALAVNESDNNASLTVLPGYVADTAAGALTLARRPGLFSADTIEIKVNDQGLLTSGTAAFDSRAPETATAAGQVIGRLESGVSFRILSSEAFDPTNATERDAAAAQLSAALRDWAGRERAEPVPGEVVAPRGAPAPTAAERAAATERAAARAARRRHLDEVTRTRVGFEWSWVGSDVMSASSACGAGAGVCVRAPRPGRLRVYRCESAPERPAPASCGRETGILLGTYAMTVPNGAPSVAVPVQGGVFADTDHTLTLSNGMLTGYRSVRGNELEGLATSAGNLLTGIAKGALDGLTSDRGLIEAETARITAQTAQLEALAKRDALPVPGSTPATRPTPEAALREGPFQVTLFGPVEAAFGSGSAIPPPSSPAPAAAPAAAGAAPTPNAATAANPGTAAGTAGAGATSQGAAPPPSRGTPGATGAAQPPAG
ncbi:hypothetical protein BZG35_08290 [Brevundimonas sp. LM2]|nr:hypothetical protein BZG35_08290 [Brevundimonas sp. LM2]